MTSIKHATYTSGILRLTMTDGRVYELSETDLDVLWCSIREADEEREYKC